MKKSEINQIPKKHPFFKDITKEDPKQKIIYKLASIRKEDTPGNKRKEIIPASENIPAKDVIVDEEGNVFHIGLVTGVDSNGDVKIGEILMGVFNFGRIIIDPKTKNAKQIAMYQYMEACNYNGSNENRDKSREVRFWRLKPEQAAQSKVAQKTNIIKVSAQVLELTIAQLQGIARILSVKDVEIMGEGQLQEAILSKVEEDPLKVEVILDDINTNVNALLKKAKELEIIGHEKNTGTFFHDGEEVFKYQPGVGVEPYALFAAYLNTENNDLLLTISSQVKLKEAEPQE